MKSVEAINDKIAFQRRKALLEQIDFNPENADAVTREKAEKLEEKAGLVMDMNQQEIHLPKVS